MSPEHRRLVIEELEAFQKTAAWAHIQESLDASARAALWSAGRRSPDQLAHANFVAGAIWAFDELRKMPGQLAQALRGTEALAAARAEIEQ